MQAQDTSPAPALRRRTFMFGVAGLSFAVAGCASGGTALKSGSDDVRRTLNAYVTLSSDGRIYIMSPAAEMGQGSFTALPLLMADEMDADWSRVEIVPAPADDKVFGNPKFGGLQYTAGSMTVAGYFIHVRRFAAQVRQQLVVNAARVMNVPAESLVTENGHVAHRASGRRIAYGELARDLQLPETAPEVRDEDLKRPDQWRYIGKMDLPRVDVAGKTNGSAQYSIDVQIPGMLYGVVSRSPVEGARAIKVDDRKARAMRGVVQVVNLNYGVGVIAERPEIAAAAREALEIEWSRDARAWGVDSESGLKRYSAAVRDVKTPGKPWQPAGDVAAATRSAARVVEREYRCDYAYHAQMEPLNVVAHVSPDGSSCELWAGSQSQTMTVAAVANALSIPRSKVVFHSMLLGGGFGRRGHRDQEFVVDGVLLSNAVKRPVKCIWSREDDVKNGRFRPMSAHFVRAAVGKAGSVDSWHHRMASDDVLPFMDPMRYVMFKQTDVIAIVGSELTTYGIPNRLSEHLPQTTGIRTSPLRGIGFGPNTFANEAFMDELAEELREDPAALRLRLLRNAPRAQMVIERVIAASGYASPTAPRGLGLAYMHYTGTELAMVVEISVSDGEISVQRVWMAIDCGVPVQPANVVAQSKGSVVYGIGLALYESISIKQGAVQESNFYDYRVPRMRDVPEIQCDVLPTANAPTGVGQMATPLVAPAIAAAFHRLTGRRLRHMPFTRERVDSVLRA